ncbi:MAG TPA: FAD-binding oxidoreductase, partial [Verrucomicrobiales bacterium]|nr:FAD-binding oxidoreductase [Verrucomicrobiales bacterium]
EPSLIGLRRAVFRGSAESDYGKKLRWNAETKLQPSLIDKTISRNQLMNESVEVFENRTTDTTDILHEYFVPRHRVVGFVDEMRSILTKHQPNLLNVTVRHVNRDHDSFLCYADQQMICFVMLYVQKKTKIGEFEMKALTRDLIDASLRNEGRYYLPYRLHATREQFYRAYPQAAEFFALKRKYDPEELFQNQFYTRYGKIDKNQ